MKLSPPWFWPSRPTRLPDGCIDPGINIFDISLDCSARSERVRLKQARRIARPTDTALVEAVIADSVAGDLQGDVGAVFEMTEHHRPSEPHWYLSLIGVDPLHRNKGCGAALLEHALYCCDKEHRAAYLWSSNKQNTSLYQRHGFEVVTTIQVGSSPPIFPMLRRPR